MIGNLRQNFGECFGGGGTHFQERMAGIGATLADGNVLDSERAAASGDQIEHLGQNKAVDNVAAHFDFFDMRHCGGRRGGIAHI